MLAEKGIGGHVMGKVHYGAEGKARTGLMGRLDAKSREELLALLEQLMQRQPEVESLIELLAELPLVKTHQEKRAGKGREPTLDPSAIRSQVDSAFDHAGEGWDAASRAAADLEHLCDIGKDFAEAGEWANAQTVYATLAEEIMLHYEGLQDEGQLSWILSMCAAGLVACLQAQSALPRNERLDSIAREELLITLFDLWIFGSNYGGVGENIAGTIAGHATAQERKSIEIRLREELRPGQDISSKWHNRSLIDFLATLKQAEHCSEDDILEEYRQAGLHKEITERLLQLGRQKDALTVAQSELTEPGDVTRFAEQLLDSDHLWQDQALTFVEMRLSGVKPALQDRSQDFTSTRAAEVYQRWLGEKYLLYGKIKQALDIQLARFQANPEYITYRCVHSAATAPGQPEDLWPGLRPQLIQTLERQDRWGALISLYLDEKQVGQALAALAALERAPGTSSGYYVRSSGSDYQTQVAEAAEESYPDEALRLYRPVVQRFIDGRGRENYQRAAGYLVRVKRLYQRQGQDAAWGMYITNLRNSNKSLRALKEELDKKGLS
jgi:hypothetical protein